MKNENIQRISDMLHELDQRAAFALNDQNYDEALIIYTEIYKAYESLKLEKKCGHTLMNIANIYMIKHDFNRSLSYIEQATNLKSMKDDPNDIGNIQIARANCLFMLDSSEEAEKVLIQELNKNKSKVICGHIELILFSYYMRCNMRTKARSAVDKAIRFFELADDKEAMKKALEYRINYFNIIGQKQYARLDMIKIQDLC